MKRLSLFAAVVISLGCSNATAPEICYVTDSVKVISVDFVTGDTATKTVHFLASCP